MLLLFIYLFIYLGCFGSSLLHVGFLQLWRAGPTRPCGVRASHCGGFSCCGALALGAQASVVVVHRLRICGLWALECRLSSCGAQAQFLPGMWDLPRPGIEPVSLALAGGFLTTAPPGKSHYYLFCCSKCFSLGHQELFQESSYTLSTCPYSFESFLPDTIRCSRLLHFPCPCCAIKCFSKKPWFCLLENGIQEPRSRH